MKEWERKRNRRRKTSQEGRKRGRGQEGKKKGKAGRKDERKL